MGRPSGPHNSPLTDGSAPQARSSRPEHFPGAGFRASISRVSTVLRGARNAARWLSVATLMLLVAVISQVSANGAQPRFELLTDPGGSPVAEVPLLVRAGSATGTTDFFIRQAGDTAIDEATLTASGSTATVTFESIEGLQVVKVPAGGEQVPVRVKVAGLTERTDLRLNIFISGKDLPTSRIGTLHIVRDDAPALSVLGAKGTTLEFTQSNAAFSRVVEIVSGTTPVAATLERADLQDTDGSQVPLAIAVDGAPISVGDSIKFGNGQLRLLILTATLPVVSTFEGKVVLSYGSPVTRLTLDISVTQTAGTQTVQVSPTQVPVNVEIPPWGNAPATAELTLREQGGQRAVLDLQVVQVTRTKNDDTTQVALQSTVSEPQLTIDPWKSRVVEVTLPSLPEAGVYRVTLRGSSAGSAPIDAILEIRARDSVFIAIACILVGTLLACLLQWWLGGARSRLLARVRADQVGLSIRRLAERVERNGSNWNPDSQQAATTFFSDLAKTFSVLAGEVSARKPPDDIQAKLDTWEKRMRLAPLWVDALTKVDSLEEADRQTALGALNSACQKLVADPLDVTAFEQALREARTSGAPHGTIAADLPRFDLPEPELSGTWLRRFSFMTVEAAVLVIFALIAVITGLKATYYTSSSWGGPRDWLVAFLWGLGVEQAGIVSAVGIQGYRAKYSPKPATP